MNPGLVAAIVVVAVVLLVVASTVHVVPTGSRAVVLRWGMVSRVVGPGLVRVVPCLDRVRVLDMQPRRAEHAARQLVSGTALRALVEERAAALAGLEAGATTTAQEWGVTVLEVDVLDVELRAGPELARLLG